MAIQPTKEGLIDYWRLFAQIEQLGCLHNKSNKLATKEFDLSAGILSAEIQSALEDGTEEVLICPCSFEYQQSQILPIWVMVKLDSDGKICPHPTVKVPFIPNIYSQAYGPFGELLGKRELIEVTVNQMFHEQPVNQSFESLVQQINQLFEKLNPALYQLNKENFKGHLLVSCPNVEPINLSSRFLKLPALDSHVSPARPKLSAGFITATNTSTLSSQLLETALKTLGLPENSFQTIEAPLCSAADDWLETMVLSLAGRQFGKLQPLSMAIVSPHPVDDLWGNEDWLEDANQIMKKDFRKKEQALDALVGRWQKEISFLNKASKAFESNNTNVRAKLDDCKSQMLTLQLKDEKFEQKFDKFSQALKDWQSYMKRSWLSKLWSRLTFEKIDEVAAEFLAKHDISLKWDKTKSLADNLITTQRAVKVKRTKIHRQLTVLASDSAELEAVLRAQQDFIQQYPDLKELEGLDALRALLEKRAANTAAMLKCLIRAEAIPVSLHCFDSAQAIDLNDDTQFDWVFFKHGESVSPIQMMPLIGQSKRVVVLGDSRITKASEVSIDFDGFLAKTFGLCEFDEELDDLQYLGHLMSQSSLYQLVSGYSTYQSTDQTGLLRLPTLELEDIYVAEPFKDYFSNHLKLKNLKTMPGKLQFEAVEPSFSTEQGWLNQNEAQALVNSISAESKGLIVTLSASQKIVLEQLLADKQLEIEVCLLDEARACDKIWLSVVYAATAPRPHRLDCGDGPLYRLMSLCRELIIFADGDLMNTATHSPTGDLAKTLQQQGQLKQPSVA